MSCWWSEYRNWYYNLSTLGCAMDQIDAPRHKRVYSDGDHSFRESDIAGNFDEIEEQLWAFRNGLSNVVYDLKLSPRISNKLLRHLKNKR